MCVSCNNFGDIASVEATPKQITVRWRSACTAVPDSSETRGGRWSSGAAVPETHSGGRWRSAGTSIPNDPHGGNVGRATPDSDRQLEKLKAGQGEGALY